MPVDAETMNGTAAALRAAGRPEQDRAQASGSGIVELQHFVATFFHESPAAVVFADAARRILSVNPATVQLFGYRAEDLVGRETRVLYADAGDYEAQGAARYNRETMRASSNYNIRYRRKNGEEFQAETTGSVVRNDAGEVTGYLGIIRDVSEQHQRQATLHRIYEISADQSLGGGEKIDALLQVGCAFYGLPLGIVSRIEGDAYAVVHAVAPGGEVAPGMNFEVAGTYCVHTLEADAPLAVHHVGSSRIAQHPCYRNFGLESYIGVPLWVDGERFGTVNFSAPEPRAPFNDTDRELIRLFAQWIGNELSRQRALKNLETARTRAEEASLAKSQFLATMSHELRTPLTGVQGMLDLLELGPIDAQQRSYIEQARLSSQSLLALLNDILDLSKVEAGHLKLERKPFDAGALVAAVVRTFRQSAAQRGLEVACEIDDRASTMVIGDPLRVRQIVTNLLANALRFTDAGGVRVMLGRSAEGGALRLDVIDTGIGIAPDRVARIFDKFEQADASTTRRYGGTGLGLAICRSLARMMGGEISVASVLGKGSRFTVVLPLGEPARAVAAAPEEDKGDMAQIEPAHLLLAEDVEINALVVTKMLEAFGHAIDVVENGLEAVRAVEAGSYDGVILDMHMPVMDGIEAARRIRALPAPKGKIPLFALTADAVSHNRHRYESAGLDAFLTKPVDWSALSAAIARHVVPYQRRRASARTPGSLSSGAPRDGTDGPDDRLDESRLRELVETLGRDSVIQFAENFDAKATVILKDLEQALRDRDEARVSALVHQLSGLAMTFGTNGFLAAVRNCDPAVGGAWPGGDAVVAAEAELRAALTEIDKAIATL